MANGVLVRHRAAKVETEEAHPTQTISDHKLHARIRKIMLRLNYQHFEHRHGIEGWATAFGAVAITETAGQKWAETLKLYRGRQNLQRIAVLAQAI